MAMDKCIGVIAQAANLSDKDVKFVQDQLDAIRNDPDFKAKAAAQAEELAKQAALEGQRAKLQIAADFRVGNRLENATGEIGKGKASWYDAAKSYLTGSSKRFKGARADTYHYSKASGESANFETLANISKIVGRQYAKLFKDRGFNTLIARELGGESTGNQTAAQVAKVFRAAYQKAMLRNNAAGADIRELPDYIFAQHHDPYKLSKAGEQPWIDSIKPLLKPETFNGEDPDKFLSNVYQNILQGSHDTPWANQDYRGASGLAKRLSRHRVLQFKDADSFLKYDAQFGRNGEVMNSALQQIQHMTQNAALMERLGPNPETFFNRLAQTVKDKSRDQGPLFTAADEGKLRNQFDALTHANQRVTSYGMAHNFALFRAAVNLAHLGTSTVSSFGDINNMAMVLHYNGQPLIQSYGNAIGTWAKYFTHPFKGPLSDVDSLNLLHSLASGFDGVNHSTAGRWSFGEDYSGTAARAMGSFFTLNGQSAWDDVVKQGTSKALATLLARQSGREWDALEAGTRRGLERADISPEEWNHMRQSEQVTIGDSPHLVPDKMDEAVGRKYAAFLLREAETSVPLPGASEQAFMKGFLKGNKGDLMHELVSTMFMFKSFPISLISKMWPRAAEMGLPGYAMALVGGLPFGYAALTVKNLLSGKEPPDITDPATTLASVMQGGAASMAGDLIMHRFDATHSLADLIAGPAVASASDLASVASAPLHGQKMGPQTVKVLARNVPFANLWFTKAAFNYLLVYQLQEAMQPGYLQRMQATAEQKYNEKYWLPPTAVK
jgi:hypothetical protein